MRRALFLFFFLMTAPIPAAKAVEAVTGTGQKSVIVTSLQKCLAQLDPESALDVQQNYLKPYQECRARLYRKLQERKTASAQKEAVAATPETPRNYVRVTPSRSAPMPSTAKEEVATPAEKPGK